MSLQFEMLLEACPSIVGSLICGDSCIENCAYSITVGKVSMIIMIFVIDICLEAASSKFLLHFLQRKAKIRPNIDIRTPYHRHYHDGQYQDYCDSMKLEQVKMYLILQSFVSLFDNIKNSNSEKSRILSFNSP